MTFFALHHYELSVTHPIKNKNCCTVSHSFHNDVKRKFLLTMRFFIFFIIITSIFSTNIFAQKTNLLTTKQHSPKRATIYSTILPGLGQIYNKQVWKVPIIYGAGAVITYLAVTNYKGSHKYKTEYQVRMNGETTNPDLINYTDDRVYALYNEYEQAFELSLIFGGVVYILNIIDALVYAHLFSFDISNNLSAHIQPFYISQQTFLQPSLTLGFSINFSFK
ncbi:MAG: DUF5683 domain-containing protein [Bacteroidales bacterium]|jgi:hypothetical protein|nr:DUF5683 domain-containing protein [Bacteroidales bacterium]